MRRISGWYIPTIMAAGVLMGIAPFAGPLLLQALVRFLEDEERPMWEGVLYAIAFTISPLLSAFIDTTSHRMVVRLGMRWSSGLITCIYAKSLVLSNSARQEISTGKIVQLMSTDAQNVMRFSFTLSQTIAAPLQIVVSIALLWLQIQEGTLGGIGVVFLLVPFFGYIAVKSGTYTHMKLLVADARTKLMGEILQGMKVIKFNNYKVPFLNRVQEIRAEELQLLKNLAYLTAGLYFGIVLAPTLIFLGSISAYTAFGNTLSVESVFVTLALFNIIRLPLATLPEVALQIVQGRVSVKRIQEFLLAPETRSNLDNEVNDRWPVGTVKIDGASFSWDPKVAHNGGASEEEEEEEESIGADESESGADVREVTLSDITLDVEPGSLVMIVGPVGAGKSSMLSAILGDIEKIDGGGDVVVAGSVAYTAQSAWIMNRTIESNITLDKPMDQKRYQRAIKASALSTDLAILPAGDQTEIGERGITLSGGQKARVALARAVYADADVYLFDDPLSAVDAHVSKHLFEELISKALRGRTRILVTHQLQYLPSADHIVVMGADGHIVEEGTFDALLEDDGDFAAFYREHVGDKHTEDSESDASESQTHQEEEEFDPHKLIEDEGMERGRVRPAVLRQYLAAVGGCCFFAVYFGLFAAFQAAQQSSDLWLSAWSSGLWEDLTKREWTTEFYLGVLACIVLLSGTLSILKEVVWVRGQMRAATNLHNGMLEGVMSAPMAFFDTTPMGRILNRFSKDVQSVDQNLPGTLAVLFLVTFVLVGMIIAIAAITWFFVLALLPASLVYWRVQGYFRVVSVEVQRLTSVSRSPLFSHFSETLYGVDTVRALRLQGEFTEESVRRLDHHYEAQLTQWLVHQWLVLRLSFIGGVLLLGASLSVTLNRGNVDIGLAGLALTYSLMLTDFLKYVVEVSTMLEQELNAVERMSEYTSLPAEGLGITNDAPKDWPSKGAVEFRNVSMRYRPELDLALRGVDASIRPGEKVGVVGRTGSGKSSLMTVLFRLVEIEDSGSLVIDGIDTKTISLEALRSKLAIIPQDPVLFAGTLRDNVDPFHECTDPEIWDALSVAMMKDVVLSTEEGRRRKLDLPVTEAGANFSVGQRQLICLARALLRKPAILILDEATASVDFETDAAIQRSVRENFASCTTLTIAHRLNTIIDADRVMVLDQGELVEFDTPATLLDRRMHFARLVDETGAASAKHLRKLARAAAASSVSITSLSTDTEEEDMSS